MEKKVLSILIFIVLIILVFFVFVDANTPILNKKDAMILGENKYLEFLWMVDGAFNDDRMNETFSVNGMKIKDSQKLFNCEYQKNKSNECMAINFEKAFNYLFANGIKYNEVYGDGITFTWYRVENNNYYFNSINSCNVERMSKEQNLRIKEMESDKIIYEVSSYDNNKQHEINNEFILIKEDNQWKVAKAYYHDLCDMDYNIG